MNRQEFEEYCREHNWRIETINEYVLVKKGNMMFKEVFKVGLNLRDLVHKMKEAEFGNGDMQGKFPFIDANELLM